MHYDSWYIANGASQILILWADARARHKDIIPQNYLLKFMDLKQEIHWHVMRDETSLPRVQLWINVWGTDQMQIRGVFGHLMSDPEMDALQFPIALHTAG